MHRPAIRVLAATAALALIAVGLAYLSRSTTQQRVYYGVPPFAVQIDVVNAQGAPVPRLALRLLDAGTLEPVAGYLVYNAIPAKGVVGDERGRVTLHFAGFNGEFEEWRLFWLFRQTPYEPQGLKPYVVEIGAPGQPPQHFPLLDLLKNKAGTIPAPEGSRQVTRYEARLTLSQQTYPEPSPFALTADGVPYPYPLPRTPERPTQSAAEPGATVIVDYPAFAFGLAVDAELRVLSVDQGSAAERAGIRAGDVLIAINTVALNGRAAEAKRLRDQRCAESC